MATLIEATTGRQAYVEVVENVRRRGRERTSRNGDVLELQDVTVALATPAHALPLGCRPGLSRQIAAAEALQLVGGFSDPDWLVNLAPQFKRFLEPNGRFWGAYGDRVSYGLQLPRLVEKLRAMPDTRQAVVTLWDSSLDNVADKLDYPCTVAVGFSRSDQWGGYDFDRLNMRVVMRSNDVWLGLPYDLFQFAQLQWTLCNVLDLLPGTYTHTAWSMHLYRSNLDASYDITEPPRFNVDDTSVEPSGIGRNGDDWAAVEARCRNLAYGRIASEKLDGLNDGERWFYDALHS